MFVSKEVIHSFVDYPDKEADAVVIYFYGCEHSCKNCHNPNFQKNPEINYKSKENIKNNSNYLYIKDVIEFCKFVETITAKYKTNYLVFSGGDPLYKTNIDIVRGFLTINNVKKKYKTTIYTGYNLEYVKNNNIKYFDFLKCGPYLERNKQDSMKDDYKFVLASKNQEIYNRNFELVSKDGIMNFC